MANEPITREEMLLNAVATGEAANLEPITREEMFLAKLGGADVTTPTPITRKEQFLQKAIEGGNSGGGGSTPGAGDGGVKVTTGTIIPLDRTTEIVHGFGSVPDYFIFYIEETTAATSRTTVTFYANPEKTIKTGISGSNYDFSLFLAFRVKDKHLARTTFTGTAMSDWGYYTLVDNPGRLYINESKIYQHPTGYTMVPFSANGALTIRWFAISGVSE